MKKRKILFIFIFLLSTALAMGQQGYIYSYIDPCTSKAKKIFIDTSNGSVPLTYNGQIRSFTDAELQSGAFQSWIDSVNSQNPSGPCSGVGLSQNTTMNVLIAQNNISIFTNVLSSLSAIESLNSMDSMSEDMSSTIGGSNIQGSIEADEKVSSNNKEENPKNNDTNTNGTNSNNTSGNSNSNGNNSNSGTNQTTASNQGTQTSNTGTGGSTSNQGNSNTTSTNTTSTGNQSSQSSVTNSTANTNNPTAANTNNTTSNVVNNNSNSPNSNGVSTITGNINSVRVDNAEQSETSDKKKESENNSLNLSSSSLLTSLAVNSKVAAVKKGSLMMNGDIVTIASTSGEPSQFKFNASVISSNTKNTFAKGLLINFTSYINNSNITMFMSYRHKKFTTILANSVMLNFDKDFFNTVSFMESYKYRKITSTIGINLTTGNLGVSKFQSISALGGVYSDFKINKKIRMTTMFVMVYSPYVYYYQGMWYDSGLLAVPFISGDYKITKKFKFNISFSGVQQINDKAISYQILTGAKCLL